LLTFSLLIIACKTIRQWCDALPCAALIVIASGTKCNAAMTITHPA
jgi:hypothetical protein